MTELYCYGAMNATPDETRFWLLAF